MVTAQEYEEELEGQEELAATAAPSIDDLPEGRDGPAVVARLLAEAQQVSELPVAIYGKRYTFKYRRLLWDDTAQIGAQAWVLERREVKGKPGQFELFSHFQQDVYNRECIMRMFMQPDLARQQPFPLTPQVLRAFPPEIGKQFEAVIPDTNGQTAAETVESLKKEYGDSLTEL